MAFVEVENRKELPAETHPEWCESCTPKAEGGFGHLGDQHWVGLSLMPPATGEDDFHGMPYFAPARLSACLVQLHGAPFPTFLLEQEVADGGAGDDVKLTLFEAIELKEVLDDLIREALRSSGKEASADA